MSEQPSNFCKIWISTTLVAKVLHTVHDVLTGSCRKGQAHSDFFLKNTDFHLSGGTAVLQSTAIMLQKHKNCKVPAAMQPAAMQGLLKSIWVLQSTPRRIGRQARSFTWSPMTSFFLSVLQSTKCWPQCQPLPSRFKNQTVKGWKFHPVCVGCWVRFSFVASVHRPIWVGAALSGPLRHCLNGSLNLDSPGYGGMNQSSNCLVGESNRRSRKGVGSPPCQVLDSLPYIFYVYIYTCMCIITKAEV